MFQPEINFFFAGPFGAGVPLFFSPENTLLKYLKGIFGPEYLNDTLSRGISGLVPPTTVHGVLTCCMCLVCVWHAEKCVSEMNIVKCFAFTRAGETPGIIVEMLAIRGTNYRHPESINLLIITLPTSSKPAFRYLLTGGNLRLFLLQRVLYLLESGAPIVRPSLSPDRSQTRSLFRRLLKALLPCPLLASWSRKSISF